ncbi:unnamed protein product [Periconia digitata]|uniref:Uncharacterized protein n=1 Tax=Periconia digitata TaxID=1303443 RepID=A0A9W4XRK3_9PLEO|nr:unnamed protein product [Periconia digitata]
MLSTLRTTSTAIAILSILGFASAKADTSLCDDGPFDKTKSYGKGNPDLVFCDTKWDKGITVTGIEAWASEFQTKAIQLSYSDGSKGPIHGDAQNTGEKNGVWYSHESAGWKQSDPVKSVSLGANKYGNGDGVGVVRMETGGGSVNVRSDVGTFMGEPQLVSSGILIGATGSSGTWLDSLSLMFLKSTVGKAEIVEIKFPQTLDELNNKQEGVEEITVKTAQYKNSGEEGSGDQDFTFENTVTQETSTSIQQTEATTFGAEVSVSASASVGVPIFAQATIETKVSAGFENTKVSTTGETKKSADSLKFSQKGVIPPGKGAECTATAQRGTYESDYTSKVRITLDGGQEFFLTQTGHAKSVGFSDAQTECKVVDLKHLDPEVEVTEVAAETKRAIRFRA